MIPAIKKLNSDKQQDGRSAVKDSWVDCREEVELSRKQQCLDDNVPAERGLVAGSGTISLALARTFFDSSQFRQLSLRSFVTNQ